MQKASTYYDLKLIGYPVRHSLSPAIHAYWLEQYGLRGRYVIGECTEETPHLVRNDNSIYGANITTPFKTSIIKKLDYVSPEAKKIGAANTIIKKENKWLGFNTDAAGFLQDLKNKNIDFKNKRVLILGAGGAAKAIAHALKPYSEFSFWSRKSDVPEACANFSLIVNCTPYGMNERDTQSFLDHFPFEPHQTFFDLLYTPEQTKLMLQAKACGAKYFGGLGMLIEQARLSFAIWTGIKPTCTPSVSYLRAKATALK